MARNIIRDEWWWFFLLSFKIVNKLKIFLFKLFILKSDHLELIQNIIQDYVLSFLITVQEINYLKWRRFIMLVRSQDFSLELSSFRSGTHRMFPWWTWSCVDRAILIVDYRVSCVFYIKLTVRIRSATIISHGYFKVY